MRKFLEKEQERKGKRKQLREKVVGRGGRSRRERCEELDSERER